jgi:hypothetical protein
MSEGAIEAPAREVARHQEDRFLIAPGEAAADGEDPAVPQHLDVVGAAGAVTASTAHNTSLSEGGIESAGCREASQREAEHRAAACLASHDDLGIRLNGHGMRELEGVRDVRDRQAALAERRIEFAGRRPAIRAEVVIAVSVKLAGREELPVGLKLDVLGPARQGPSQVARLVV